MFPSQESIVIPTARAVHQAAPPVAAVHRAAEAEAFNAENLFEFYGECCILCLGAAEMPSSFNVKNYEEY